ARYVSDAEKGQPAPMPFFRDLAERAWDLQRHYTTSNVSTKAVFSIFSGLYDLFNRDALGTRRDAMVPSISNFLPREYDSFLVTPASSSWYFPVQFMKNSGLPEMHTYENLPFQVREETVSLGRYIARDEIQTVDFFLKRVDKAREPFLGIYISFAAHFPYFDYGPDYRVRGDDGRMISRYYNNLKLLDAMIRRIFEHLQASGKLERTILVIAGDHGQAFGQHQPDNYLHYRYLYNENLEVPVILYQPRLFPARKITVPTSHVDLLPTILDAVKVPYDPSLLDGESLFQNKLGRRYLFFYGLDESVASLDDQGIKVHSSRKKNVCRVYDLKQDPGETHPLDCSSYSRQAEALRAFIAYHDTRLLEYNAEIGAGKDFRGRRHPTVWIAERKRAESPPPSPPPARGRAGVVGNESNAELGIGNAESKSSAPNAESEPRSKVGSTDAPGEGEKAVRRNVVRSSEPDEKLGGNDSINSR
ncbi:MAG TPA: sulfatase-like hydrolase/transferase, partial [Thermodesulfobacteriota bacterium]|nr:sulfatase-like hydrolase/transferase [Thermodesulfobacteriota bacterium]